MTDTQIVIEPPIKGEWAIMNPPGHAVLAFDFLATNGKKLPYRGGTFLRHVFSSIQVSETYACGQPVLAPLAGEVVACSDGSPDRERISMIKDLVKLFTSTPAPGSPFQAYGGNYIILRCGDVYPLLAHLKSGSIRVKVGNLVQSGDPLGEIGNSGMSLQPHLHFQMMSTEDPFPLFKNLLPFRINRLRKRVGQEWMEMTDAEIKNGDRLLL